jgi:ATP-dependent DNA ligase
MPPATTRNTKRSHSMLTKTNFIAPCLPTLRNEPPTGPGWLHEVKFDGYRMQIHKERTHVALYSRNGNDFTERFPQTSRSVTNTLCFDTRMSRPNGFVAAISSEPWTR